MEAKGAKQAVPFPIICPPGAGRWSTGAGRPGGRGQERHGVLGGPGGRGQGATEGCSHVDGDYK